MSETAEQASYPSFASYLRMVSGPLDGLTRDAAHGFAKDKVPTGIDHSKRNVVRSRKIAQTLSMTLQKVVCVRRAGIGSREDNIARAGGSCLHK